MTVQEYRDYIAAGNPVVAGSEAHLFMHKMSQEAIRITMEINNRYHTPEELRQLFSELWNIDVPDTEDKNIECRKELYTAEAKAHYNGNVFVPEDLETITL